MKTLTLTQPWATLVAIGAKRIETRSWSTSYRGPLAIHAAKGFPKWAREFSLDPECYDCVRTNREPLVYPLGCVIATCRLMDCLEIEEVNQHRLTTQELAFGDYSPGRFAWLLEDIHPLPEPITAKGALGLWEWTPPALVAGYAVNRPDVNAPGHGLKRMGVYS
jgi:hypothetical protein